MKYYHLIFYYYLDIFVTGLACIPWIQNHLNRVFGKSTLQKLGFNSPFRMIQLNGKTLLI